MPPMCSTSKWPFSKRSTSSGLENSMVTGSFTGAPPSSGAGLAFEPFPHAGPVGEHRGLHLGPHVARAQRLAALGAGDPRRAVLAAVLVHELQGRPGGVRHPAVAPLGHGH